MASSLNWYLLVAFGFTSFTIAMLAFPVLIKLLTQWKLFDNPSRHKIHQHFTPSMGGICILLGVGFTLAISLPLREWITMKFFFVGLAAIFITGLRDDILTLSPRQKLLGQLLPIVLVVVFGKVTLSSFYELGAAVFPVWLSIIITIFTIVILTNAYNLIDGLDGLAGTVGAIALLFYGVWFYHAGSPYLAIVAITFLGAILAFLVFNWQPSRIFMGDTGALSIGFTLSFLTVCFINQNFQLEDAGWLHFTSSISTAVCVMIIPVFDTLRVIILRLSRWQSPFKADRNHLHHQLLLIGLSHAGAVMVLAGVNLFFIVLAFVLRNQPDLVILPLVGLLCLLLHFFLHITHRTKNRYASANHPSAPRD
jgi:UDP-N-acetylmuramyl pentapeptide phosphotransferase/UDP-N-acetylglucosamine-1-phosphate transferase